MGQTKTAPRGRPKRLRLVGYARVSTDNQAQEGTIEIQKLALSEYAKAQGHELVKVFSDEGVSGGLENRPGLAELFDYLERDQDTDGVLIFKLDRLARDLMIQENLPCDLTVPGWFTIHDLTVTDLDGQVIDPAGLPPLDGLDPVEVDYPDAPSDSAVFRAYLVDPTPAS